MKCADEYELKLPDVSKIKRPVSEAEGRFVQAINQANRNVIARYKSETLQVRSSYLTSEREIIRACFLFEQALKVGGTENYIDIVAGNLAENRKKYDEQLVSVESRFSRAKKRIVALDVLFKAVDDKTSEVVDELVALLLNC